MYGGHYAQPYYAGRMPFAVSSAGLDVDDQHKPAKPPSSFSCCGTADAQSIVHYLLNVFFVILSALTLYALFVSAGDTVRAACPLLWEFFLVRCTVGICVLAFLTGVTYRYGHVATRLVRDAENTTLLDRAGNAVYQQEQPEADQAGDPELDGLDAEHDRTVMAQMLTAAGFSFLYLVVFAVLETLVLTNIVMNKQQCIDALKVGAVGSRPMLADLGAVYAALDYSCAIYLAYSVIRPQMSK